MLLCFWFCFDFVFGLFFGGGGGIWVCLTRSPWKDDLPMFCKAPFNNVLTAYVGMLIEVLYTKTLPVTRLTPH